VKLNTNDLYKSVVNSVKFDCIHNKGSLLALLRQNKLFIHKKSKAINILEKFNNQLCAQVSTIDLLNILKNILLQDLGCNFYCICRSSKELEAFDITYIDANKKYKPCSIFKQDINNAIIKASMSRETFMIEKNLAQDLGFKIPPETKQVIIKPIIIQNKLIAILCIGKINKKSASTEIFNLICQQTGLILTNNELKDQLKQSLSIDPLTSLVTHSHFQQRLNFELKRSERNQEPLSLIMIDVNNIKQINESHSHILGDEVISYVAEILKENIRDIDIAARFSGDKMAVMLPNTNSRCARIIAERFESEVSNSKYLDIGNITVSIGIASWPDNSKDKQALLNNADKALSLAKKECKKLAKSTIINADDLIMLNEFSPEKTSILLEDYKSIYDGTIDDELINNLYLADQMQYNSTLLLEIITSLAAAIDAKDSYTRGHSQAVSRYSELLCQELGLAKEETEKIKIGALMHDIGKIGIPENVLGKPTMLDDEEWQIMKQHPTIGARRIIQPISALNDLIPVVEHHHERWDGTGYPYGLRQNEIPLGARIVSIADAFHTMTTDRPYRNSLGYDEAVERLVSGSGAQWDHSLVQSFLRISKKAYEYAKKDGSHL
jgi:diguanylate cyclase (GGDEF)-like protein/putative nucleotidyltransferase with HDIG domain